MITACAGEMRGGSIETIVVPMRHDERADHPRAHSPAGRPRIFELAVARLKLDPGCLRKVLPEEMRGACLDGFSILDHRLDAKRAHRPGKALTFRLLAGDYRNRQIVPRESLIDAEHFHGFRERLGFSLVRGVALLPEELRRAKEQPGPQLPANHICPLVEKHGQVAPDLIQRA